jgi:VIT1/CCC1 family predicted Fe2+/Mn2+ transporter
VFTLALMQNAETRSPYADDPDATDQMDADEAIHAEVVRSLATRSRARMSGTFRAAVFGANDGLVSNLALVLGVGATGVPAGYVLATGISGLLAGALSMAAGEYVSVSSQRELLRASTPNPDTDRKIPALDVNENELALVYRARGLDPDEAKRKATETLIVHRLAAGRAARDRARGGHRRHRAAAHRWHRRRAVGRGAVETRAAAAAHWLRCRRRHLPARPRLRRRRRGLGDRSVSRSMRFSWGAAVRTASIVENCSGGCGGTGTRPTTASAAQDS